MEVNNNSQDRETFAYRREAYETLYAISAARIIDRICALSPKSWSAIAQNAEALRNHSSHEICGIVKRFYLKPDSFQTLFSLCGEQQYADIAEASMYGADVLMRAKDAASFSSDEDRRNNCKMALGVGEVVRAFAVAANELTNRLTELHQPHANIPNPNVPSNADVASSLDRQEILRGIDQTTYQKLNNVPFHQVMASIKKYSGYVDQLCEEPLRTVYAIVRSGKVNQKYIMQ
ncbi:MAG: hypothetical protein ABTQ34_04600 [Bdellovibrionales bacterium]